MEVQGRGRLRIDAAYPIVVESHEKNKWKLAGSNAPAADAAIADGRDTTQMAKGAGSAAAAGPPTWHVQEGGAEWARLRDLGEVLLQARGQLGAFLQFKCDSALQ